MIYFCMLWNEILIIIEFIFESICGSCNPVPFILKN